MGAEVGIVAVVFLLTCIVGVVWSFVLVRLKQRQVADEIEYYGGLTMSRDDGECAAWAVVIVFAVTTGASLGAILGAVLVVWLNP